VKETEIKCQLMPDSYEKSLKLLAILLGENRERTNLYCLYPKYQKELLKKIDELKNLLDIYNWSEELFFYTRINPKKSGLPYQLLVPDFPLEGKSPYILIPDKKSKEHNKRVHYIRIDISELDNIKGPLKKFVLLNHQALVFHWAQVWATSEMFEHIVELKSNRKKISKGN
jgi:hypothetical protein